MAAEGYRVPALEHAIALLRFLKRIGAVESWKKKTAAGLAGNVVKWRTTERMQSLYQEVADAKDKN